MRPRSRPSGLAVTVLALLLAGCSGERPSTPAPTAGAATAATPEAPARPHAVSVTAASVQARDVQRTVETTGSLLAWQEVVLNTAVPGTVARLHVDLGDRVDAGQVLAELDRREFTLAVQQAQAALRAARDGLARAQAEASRASLQQVRQGRGSSWEANLSRWRAALDEAQLNLERSQRLVDAQLVAQRELDAARTQHETTLAQYRTAQVEMQQYPDKVRVAEAQLQSDLSAVRVAESEILRREAEVGTSRWGGLTWGRARLAGSRRAP